MLIMPVGLVRTRITHGPGTDRVFGPIEAIGGDKGASPSLRLRILIVEDEVVVAMRLEDMVQDLGYGVVGTAASHAGAVAAAEASRPDLVLMDINLGRGGDGVEAALELRQRFDLPSIFVSAYASSPEIKAQARAAQPLGFVPKPYTERDISAALGQAATRLGRREH